MNVAETTAYKSWQEKCDPVFQPQLRQPDYDQTEELAGGFTVISRAYGDQVGNYRILASENELQNGEGRVIYTWRNLNIDGAFCYLFRHANGNSYLVFRRDLYGYSVYELESGREMHYIPSQAYPEDEEEFQETFIWTDAHYDPQSNLLAVGGCFWAAPSSVIVLDFSHPLQEQPVEQWFDTRKIVDPEWEIYEDVDFAGWGQGELLLSVLPAEGGKNAEIRLPVSQLGEKLKAVSRLDISSKIL